MNPKNLPNDLKKKKESCPICKLLGESIYVDYDDDQHFPDEVLKLKMIQWLSESNDVRQCPQCDTYYYFTFETDNDIFQPWHTGAYKRIPRDEAERIVNEERAYLEKVKREYRKKVWKKYGQIIQSLPELEKQIVEYLAERLYNDKSPENISKDLGIELHIIEQALLSLKEKKVVSEYSKKYCIARLWEL